MVACMEHGLELYLHCRGNRCTSRSVWKDGIMAGGIRIKVPIEWMVVMFLDVVLECCRRLEA